MNVADFILKHKRSAGMEIEVKRRTDEPLTQILSDFYILIPSLVRLISVNKSILARATTSGVFKNFTLCSCLQNQTYSELK